MPVSGRRPYTELFEVAQKELVREAASDEEGKYSGFVNQAYMNDLPDVLPERYLKTEAFITTAADYTTGTVTVGTGTANIVGVSTVWTSANSDDFYITVDGFNQSYRVSFDAGTSLNYQQSLGWTTAGGSGLTYTLFQDRYALPAAFNYMTHDDPTNPNVVYIFINGVKTFMTPWTNEEYDRNFTATIGSIHAYTVGWTSQTAYLRLQANPDDIENIGYSYIPILNQLRELTTGTATLTTGTSLVLTSDASITTSLDTARTLYFRNDADGTGSSSKWFQISSVANGSVATLSTVYTGTSSGASQVYTISEISQWPSRFDDAILYKAAWVADPDGKQSEKWLSLYTAAIGGDLTIESKRKRQSKLKSFPGLRR